MSRSCIEKGKLENDKPRVELDYWTLPNRTKFLQFIQDIFYPETQAIRVSAGDEFCRALHKLRPNEITADFLDTKQN